MVIRSLQNGEQDACLDLWDAAFKDTPRSYFEKYFKDPTWKPEDTVVCEESGRLVSAVHVVRRIVETREGRKNMAGIANVGTDPSFRGHGFSTRCLEEVHRRLDADPGLDFGLLGTGIHDYYARLGWQRWEFSGWEAPNPFLGWEYEYENVGLYARPATENDLPQIMRWYSVMTHFIKPIAVVRDEVYWRNWLNWKPDGYLVTEKGYARVRTEDGVPTVTEIGGEFPLYEAMGTVAPKIRFYGPSPMPEGATPLPIPWWMVRPLQGKPLPDLEGGYFYDADGF
jgi:predicted N-acetyltransferase YhbS